MASPELRRLWALHEIDAEILDLRRQAARLGAGFEEAAKLKALEAKDADVGAKARALISEQVDTELKQKGLEDRIKKFDSQLFGGSVTSAREVESIQKEIQLLKRERDALDDRLLELMDEAPAAKKIADSLAAEIADAKRALSERRQQAMAEKGRIEAAYKVAVGKREAAKQQVTPALLNRYETILKRYDGVGMAEVIKKRQCGACGTQLPERTIRAALDGTVVTCESCHRILYHTEGVV